MRIIWQSLIGVVIAFSDAAMGGISAQQALATTDEKIVARMASEKAARRACKIEICNAFARPAAGTPIECEVTKTWLRDEIASRVVGGNYVWGYGHLQCSLKLKLDRAEIGKIVSEKQAKATFAEHVVACNVDDKDPAKGTSFNVKVAVTPVTAFENGEIKAVSVEPVKTEGSAIASAAVTSLLAIDKISGAISRAAAAEINSFLYDKCKDDGIMIARKL